MVRTLREGLPDARTMDCWSAESKAQLNEKFGKFGAKIKLAGAQEFVRNREGLALIMRRSGLGSHPDVVMALAGNAHNLRMKPRTRKK